MRYESIRFDISDQVLALGVTGAYFTMGRLDIKATDAEFEHLEEGVVSQILPEISIDKIRENRILQGFRQLHEAVGVSNKKNVSSSENLFLTLFKTGSLPNINLLVDIYNLVSIETGLALGAHDLARVSGNIQLKLTSGTEGFLPLGAEEPKPVRPNCYSYIDDENDIICWLEVRQVEKTKTTLATTESFFIVQGNPATDAEYLKTATERLIALIKQFCGGNEKMLYAPWI